MAKRANIIDTRLEIIQTGLKLFLEHGYAATTQSMMTQALNISPGNMTYYFPTKEHLLAVLTQEICDYQQIVLENEIEEGKTSLLAYCMELMAMAAVCEEDERAKELYLAIYRHPITLNISRKNDMANTKEIFAEFNPDWTDSDYALAENITSGIEYGIIETVGLDGVSLDKRISSALDAVLKLYNVPKELRRVKIEKVLNMDYRKIGKIFINDLHKYIASVNDKAIKKAKRKRTSI